jgi:hypothetical protein
MLPTLTLGRRHWRNEEAIARPSAAPNARPGAFPATRLQPTRTRRAGVGPDAGCGWNAAAAEVVRAVVESPVLVVGWDSRQLVIEPPRCPFKNGGDEEERRGWLRPVSRPAGHLRSTPPQGPPFPCHVASAWRHLGSSRCATAVRVGLGAVVAGSSVASGQGFG